MHTLQRYTGAFLTLFISCFFISKGQASGTPLLSQSHTALSARNHWKYLKEDESRPEEVHNAWGQAINLDYQSGYLFDTIGFDAAYTGVIKLAASDYFSTRGLLYNDGNGFDKRNARGYNKIGQRYVKLKLGDDDSGLKVKAGWQVLKNYGVLTASHQLSQNSYTGYSATVRNGNMTFDSAWVFGSVNRDSPNKVQFLTADKQQVSAIATAGLSWKDSDLSLSWGYGEAKDYVTRHVIEMGWKPAEHLILGSQIYGTHGLTTYNQMADSRKAFDHDSWHYAGDIKWQEKDWSTTLGLAWTRAEKVSGLGYYDRHITKNMRGRFNAMTSAGSDYMRDGELALTMLGEYQFFKNVITGLQVNYGQFHFRDNTVRTGEVSLINRWAPAEGELKNLSVFSMLSYGWSYKNQNKTPVLDNSGRYQRSPSLAAEIIIDYKFKLF